MKVSLYVLSRVLRMSYVRLYNMCMDGSLQCFRDDKNAWNLHVCDAVKAIIDLAPSIDGAKRALLELAEKLIRKYRMVGCGRIIIIALTDELVGRIVYEGIYRGIDTKYELSRLEPCLDEVVKKFGDVRSINYIIIEDESSSKHVFVPIGWR